MVESRENNLMICCKAILHALYAYPSISGKWAGGHDGYNERVHEFTYPVHNIGSMIVATNDKRKIPSMSSQELWGEAVNICKKEGLINENHEDNGYVSVNITQIGVDLRDDDNKIIKKINEYFNSSN